MWANMKKNKGILIKNFLIKEFGILLSLNN